jgi:hypothetical protein
MKGKEVQYIWREKRMQFTVGNGRQDGGNEPRGMEERGISG